MSLLLTTLGTGLGMTLSRGISSFFGKISNSLFPYGKSKEAERVEHTANKNLELEQIRQKARFQELSMQLNANAELQKQLQMTARETNILVSRFTAQENLKNTFWQDAIRRFPLNISPISILENNGINIELLTKGFSEKNMSEEQIQELRTYLFADKKPLNVFILPITIDSRVSGKETIAAQVWDSVYQNVESIFVNEYNSCGDRPVSLYSTAWNQNAKPGLHAAEEIYFFLKYLPSVVIEPRFDGKKLKIMFICWGIGYTLGQRVRQELIVDLDWLPIITTNAYERSKENIKLMEKIDVKEDTFLKNKKASYLHNIKMYEDLGIGKRLAAGRIDELNTLGDYSKWFALDSYDWGNIADTVSSTLGLAVAAISDTHHLLSSDVEPLLPQIYNKYFSSILNDLLTQSLVDMYEQSFYKLALMDETSNKKALTVRDMQIRNIYGAFRISCPNKENPLESIVSYCKVKWDYEAEGVNDAFDYYVEHFTFDDAKFTQQIMPYLSKEQKKMVERRNYDLKRL